MYSRDDFLPEYRWKKVVSYEAVSEIKGLNLFYYVSLNLKLF